jgi:hypothetical protein
MLYGEGMYMTHNRMHTIRLEMAVDYEWMKRYDNLK